MILKRISILNYKNLEQVELSFSPKLNCFFGQNGMGKTNLLDAVYFLSFCKSAGNPIDSQNICHDADFFVIQGFYEAADGTPEEIYCGMKRRQKKQFKRNKKEYTRLSDHIGFLPLVMVSPADSELIAGGSDERRRFMDVVISQYDKEYLDALIRYNKALVQRNTLLKSEQPVEEELFLVWEEMMAQAGEVVFIGMKAVGIAQKYAVIVLMGIVAVMTVGTFLHPLNTLQRAEFHWNNLLALYSMVVFATSANQAVIQVVKGLDGNAKQIRRSIFIGFGLSSVFVLIVTGTVLLGTKGALEKELAYMQLGESIGTWAMILAGIFSLFALLTTFWSNTLALRDVVHEQIGSGNRISWLIATVPCILFAVFGVNSFIVLTRIMSGVVVLVSIMLVLTYGKSRKKAGSSPICGVIGTVPFQVLMVISTVLSAIGALIPLS